MIQVPFRLSIIDELIMSSQVYTANGLSWRVKSKQSGYDTGHVKSTMTILFYTDWEKFKFAYNFQSIFLWHCKQACVVFSEYIWCLLICLFMTCVKSKLKDFDPLQFFSRSSTFCYQIKLFYHEHERTSIFDARLKTIQSLMSPFSWSKCSATLSMLCLKAHIMRIGQYRV